MSAAAGASLLGLEGMPAERILRFLETADSLREISERDIKKVPTLRGKTVVSLFYEPSTRTRMSFEIAAKRMSADFVSLSASASSVTKGESLRDTIETIAAMAGDLGRAPPRAGQFIFFAVHEDRGRAVEMAAERLSRQYNQDFSQLVHRYALAGTPDDCVARLREYVDAGARTIILNSACPGGYADANEALMAQEVVPAIREYAT